MTKKSFRVGSTAEPKVFELEGTDTKGQPIEPISFTCQPEIQGAVLSDMIAAVNENAEMAAVELADFIRQCLMPDQLERYDEVTHGDQVIVPILLLVDILRWLIEEYSQRPTGAPSSLVSGPTPTEASLTGAASGLDSQIPVPSL